METATIEAQPEVNGQPEEQNAEQSAAATQATPEKMFKHSEWVHVGEGASECPHVVGEENAKHQGRDCDDEEHFHAFCRLPNQFQHRDIVEKATAAKARRIRLLNDRESDAYEVLDSTLRMIAGTEDPETVIEELLSFQWEGDYIDALRQVEEEERFEHIDQDRQELRRLLELPEEERSGEALEAIEKHMQDYVEASRAKLKEVQKPRREALEALSSEERLKLLRERRVEADADEEYHHVFSQWEWFIGTRAPDRRTQKFTSIREMTEDSAPELVERLQNVYQGLRLAMQRGGRGNS